MMSEWRPIETAPKDGTSILLHFDSPHRPQNWEKECSAVNTAVGQWWEGDDAWICYMDMVRDPECHFEPTHWMPLPEPPEDS